MNEEAAKCVEFRNAQFQWITSYYTTNRSRGYLNTVAMLELLT